MRDHLLQIQNPAAETSNSRWPSVRVAIDELQIDLPSN